MVINKELRDSLKKLKEYFSSEEFNMEKFSKMLNSYSVTLNISEHEILLLLLNKEYLFLIVSEQTKAIDNKINMLQNEINQLKKEKANLGSLICSLHGHILNDDPTRKPRFCINCGESLNLGGTKQIELLNREAKQKVKIYENPKDYLY